MLRIFIPPLHHHPLQGANFRGTSTGPDPARLVSDCGAGRFVSGAAPDGLPLAWVTMVAEGPPGSRVSPYSSSGVVLSAEPL